MKEILLELSEAENYASLPLYQKRLFWAIIEHFLHHDHEKFTLLCALAAKWMLEGKQELKFLFKEENS